MVFIQNLLKFKHLTKVTICISDIHKSVAFEITALELRKKGIETEYVLINCASGVLESFLIQNNFTVHSFENKRLINSFSLILKVRKLLKRNKSKVIHCHLAQANWVGLWASKLAGIKTRIYTRHSGESFHETLKEKVIDKIQNKLATKIVSISENISELLVKQGVSKSKIQLIHHGFDLMRFSSPNPVLVEKIKTKYNSVSFSPTIGVIARWMKWKGIQNTIKAFKETLMLYPNALLCIFGASANADFSKEIEELLLEIPDENICVVPFEENVFDLYQLFDIYVHVPINESCEAFGQTYVESLAAGVPSIFTLSGIAREFIVDKKNALVVPFNDSNSIKEAITLLLEDANLRAQLIENGKSSVKELFTFEKYIQNLIELYTH